MSKFTTACGTCMASCATNASSSSSSYLHSWCSPHNLCFITKSPSHDFLSVTKPGPHQTSFWMSPLASTEQVGLRLQMLWRNILHFSYVNALLTTWHLPSPLLLVISNNLPSLSPSWPDMNFYLISRITSAHLTSNSMLCDNTLLCPRTLFSSPMGSWLGSPQPREATWLSLFQPPEGHKEPRLGPNHQSHLCCCLDNTSPRPAPPLPLLLLLDVPCSNVEADPVLPCLCPPRGLQTFTRKWPLTFTLKSDISQRTCKFTIDFLH